MGKIYCCVVDCHNHSGQIVDGRRIRLHRFPADRKINRIWQTRVSRKKWQPSAGTKLCSDHFEGRLGPTKDNPLPTIFPHKVYALGQISERKPKTCRVADQENVPPQGYIDVTVDMMPTFPEDDEYPIPVNFDASGLSEMDTSLHLHDYLKNQFDSSCLSNKRNTESQTKPLTATFGGQFNSFYPVAKSTRTIGTQTPIPETRTMEVQVTLPVLTIEDLEEDDQVNFYTGLPNRGVFCALFDDIESAMQKDRKRAGRPRKLRLVDEFIMFLMRLRLGLLIKDLADRFYISKSGCAQIINTWTDFLSVFLAPLLKWPSRDVIKDRMPHMFKVKYPNCRIIIDCTELFTQTPQSLINKSLMYSDYKSHMTWKLLLGISPSGVITFVSELWTGSISDKMITQKSGLLDLLEPGDAVMADKGFLIADLLTPRGVYLIMPPKRQGGHQMSRQQVETTRRISNLRIHVERAMERIKNFRIIQGVMPITISKHASNIVKVICCLSNLQAPLIQDK